MEKFKMCLINFLVGSGFVIAFCLTLCLFILSIIMPITNGEGVIEKNHLGLFIIMGVLDGCILIFGLTKLGFMITDTFK